MSTVEPGSIDHLSQVISQVGAPAFLVGGVMSFISILVTRLGGVLDRLRQPADSPEDAHSAKIGIEISRLRRRVSLLNRAIYFAIGSGVVAVVLVIVSFAAAL